MPPRIVQVVRSGLLRRVFLSALAWWGVPLAGQELDLQRDYPGSGPFTCPAPIAPRLPDRDERARAAQLATDATQAMILGNLERVEILLSRALTLDGTSADLAYRHARVLEDISFIDEAMNEYCRAIDLGVASIGVFDVQGRIDVLEAQIRTRLPEDAQDFFRAGLAEADDSLYTDALQSFTGAMEAAPEWETPVFNRAVIYDRLGRFREGLADFRTYLTFLNVDPETASAIAVSQRIGLLEGAASVVTPSPSGALVLGIVPGMGHYYNGRAVKGTITFGLAASAVATGFLFKNITVLCLDLTPSLETCPPDLIVDEVTETPYAVYGLVVAAAITIYGAIDAMRQAKRRRSEAEAISMADPRTGPQLGLPTVSFRGSRIDLNLVRVIFR